MINSNVNTVFAPPNAINRRTAAMDMNKVPLQIVDGKEERITNEKFARNAEKVEDIFNSIGFVEVIEAPRLPAN